MKILGIKDMAAKAEITEQGMRQLINGRRNKHASPVPAHKMSGVYWCEEGEFLAWLEGYRAGDKNRPGPKPKKP